jgi:NADH-quinone oxidoreductase subunit L
LVRLVWLVPLLPLCGFLLNGLLGRRLGKRAVALIGPGVVGLAFAVSVGIFIELLGRSPHDRSFQVDLFSWIPSGDLQIDAGLLVDPLSTLMALIVTGVGFLIHVYSVGYMREDEGFWRYFAYLNLFTFAMLVLVLANSFPLLFVGWEGVGLCSYLLIGFWFDLKINADAGKKAFIVNRVGDFAFLVGMFLIFRELGTLRFSEVFERAPGALEAGGATAFWIALLLFIGATGKSAQIPLHVWLPDAMQGPTPVSALIHAATMVTAGVYMIARTHVLYLLAPEALLIVAVIGAATAIFAATIGIAQTDIKRVLAYSTISQLGYMFLGVGVGAFAVGIFHLMTHAFFKALLFLGAGSVIHALHQEQDMRRMGGLRAKLPLTFRTMLIGTLAISGIPPLAGFFSKDEILWSTWSAGLKALWGIGFLAAILTALYMFRLIFLTFFGEPRDRRLYDHAHEPSRAMTVPLLILAALSIVGGWIGIPHALGALLGGLPNLFETWLEPVFANAEGLRLDAAAEMGELATEYALMGASVAAAALGIWLAARIYSRPTRVPAPARSSAPDAISRAVARVQHRSVAVEFRDPIAEKAPSLYRVLAQKYYVDELYNRLFVRPYLALSAFCWRIVDALLIDGFVVRAVGGGVAFYSRVVARLQTGLVQNYATAFFVGAVVLLGWYLFR